jgi:hypothetical protein
LFVHCGIVAGIVLQVGTGNNMAGKETLVLSGLDATRMAIDDFLVFFPSTTVSSVQNRIREENELNAKEFDTKTLGQLLNMPNQGDKS